MSKETRDQFRAILREQVASHFVPSVSLGVQREVLDGMGKAAEMPEGVKVEQGKLANLNCEWITGPGSSPKATLLHLHGGGYVMGSCNSHRALTARAAIAGRTRAVLPEYRLAPEHPFPAAVNDAVAAYRALLDQGISPRDISILGDSAGGGLTLSLLLSLRDAKIELPAAAVLLSPWTDMTFSGESMKTRAEVDPWLKAELMVGVREAYLQGHDPKNPGASPLLGDLSGLPPLLIQVGDQEVLLSDSTRLFSRAKEAGVEAELEVGEELWHVFQLFAPGLPEANEAFERMGIFLRKHLKS